MAKVFLPQTSLPPRPLSPRIGLFKFVPPIQKRKQPYFKPRPKPVVEKLVDNRPLLPSGKVFPLPLGDSHYALAKQAEYLSRDLKRAEELYRISIVENDRAESALKDLASLLHQQGRTSEAVDLLEKYQSIAIEEPNKIRNLLENLKKQLVPQGNSLNKCLKLTEVDEDSTVDSIKSLFKNSTRIQKVEFKKVKGYYSAYVYFKSHSSARKTLEGFQHFAAYSVEWVSVDGNVVSNANPSKCKAEFRKSNPPFEYSLFERDPENWYLPIPVDLAYKTQVIGSVTDGEFQELDVLNLLGRFVAEGLLEQPQQSISKFLSYKMFDSLKGLSLNASSLLKVNNQCHREIVVA